MPRMIPWPRSRCLPLRCVTCTSRAKAGACGWAKLGRAREEDLPAHATWRACSSTDGCGGPAALKLTGTGARQRATNQRVACRTVGGARGAASRGCTRVCISIGHCGWLVGTCRVFKPSVCCERGGTLECDSDVSSVMGVASVASHCTQEPTGAAQVLSPVHVAVTDVPPLGLP